MQEGGNTIVLFLSYSSANFISCNWSKLISSTNHLTISLVFLIFNSSLPQPGSTPNLTRSSLLCFPSVALAAQRKCCFCSGPVHVWMAERERFFGWESIRWSQPLHRTKCIARWLSWRDRLYIWRKRFCLWLSFSILAIRFLCLPCFFEVILPVQTFT